MIDNFLQEPYQSYHKVYQHPQSTHCIYLGDVSAALDMDFIQQAPIRTVVTAAAGMDHLSYGPTVKHVVYPLLDAKHELIAKLFSQFYELCQKELQTGHILVHCAAGISRSATLVIAYLMRKEQWSFRQAILFVRKSRPSVCPNLGFERQLKAYQQMNRKSGDEEADQQRRLISKTSEARTHGLEPLKSKLPEIGKSKILEVKKSENQSGHIARTNLINISFYNQFRGCKDARAVFSRERDFPNQIEKDAFQLKLRGMKHNLSYTKKKQSSISHRSEHRKMNGNQFLERQFYQQKVGLGEANNFKVIKLHGQRKFTTQKAIGQDLRVPFRPGQ